MQIKSNPGFTIKTEDCSDEDEEYLGGSKERSHEESVESQANTLT